MNNQSEDLAIKFGAGRYRQGRGVLREAGRELKRLGKRLYLLAGRQALDAVRDVLLESIEVSGLSYEIEVYEGSCSYEAAKRSAERCRKRQADVIVGIGGGRIMDFAKAAAEFAGTGVYLIPTSAATCAAFTSMSIMYREDGSYRNNWRYGHEADGVLVDLNVIAACPWRYSAAGILDAMAKWIEISNGQKELLPEEVECDRYTAYAVARYVYDGLMRFGIQAIEDIREKRVSRAVEYMTFLNIAATGLSANIVRSSGQSALAHELYYQLRTHFGKEIKDMLHGEIVGTGLLLQLKYNGMEAELEQFYELLQDLSMPVSLSQLGIPETESNIHLLEKQLAASLYVEDTEEARQCFAASLRYLYR